MQSLFETMSELFTPILTQAPRSSRQLMNDLMTRYTLDDITESVGLQTLYGYLKIRLSLGGMDHTIPSVYMRDLISFYIGYTYPIFS